MGDTAGPSRRFYVCLALLTVAAAVCFVAWNRAEPAVAFAQSPPQVAETATSESESAGAVQAKPWQTYLPPSVILSVVLLLMCSAFFSGSETAFFSIHRVRLRAMREESRFSGRLISRLMEHPGRFLTTILTANMIVNIMIGVLLGTRLEELLSNSYLLPSAFSYLCAVLLSTMILVFFGEISPKVFAVQLSEGYARVAAFPLLVTDKVLMPLREGGIYITDVFFRLTRFSQMHAAPFITDEEFKAVLTSTEALSVLEEEERQMIQGILEFSDRLLREILVPRPNVIAVDHEATLFQALDVLREHEYSRMPVYRDSLDNVVGILVGKDMLPSIAEGRGDESIKPLLRPAHFVPETMSVRQFVNDARRKRAHLAVVVDEYGGTAGIVTLEDALEEVVGDIVDEDEESSAGFELLDSHTYRVDGGYSLHELSELIDIEVEDEEHDTVGGFVMDRTDKIPEPGDTFEFSGTRFTVEQCDGRRVVSVLIELPGQAQAHESEPA